jgi:signal transduction histidine kinase
MDILSKGIGRDAPATLNQMLQRCQVRAGQMRKLVNDLLDLTRIESGQKKRELAELDVHELARQAIEGVKPEAAGKGVAVRLHGDGPTKLPADRGEIEIVLNNLVSNAVKYNRPGGEVDVRIEQPGGKTVISVADTGIGMSAEEAGRLFTEFVRIRNDKTRNILGSGLGLSIVKKIALLYDGQVSVSSTPDAGSAFTVTLGQAGG